MWSEEVRLVVDDVITAYKNIMRKLGEKPNTIEHVFEIREWMESIPFALKTQDDIMRKVHAVRLTSPSLPTHTVTSLPSSLFSYQASLNETNVCTVLPSIFVCTLTANERIARLVVTRVNCIQTTIIDLQFVFRMLSICLETYRNTKAQNCMHIIVVMYS